jgi:hypothetical protein
MELVKELLKAKPGGSGSGAASSSRASGESKTGDPLRLLGKWCAHKVVVARLTGSNRLTGAVKHTELHPVCVAYTFRGTGCSSVC